MTKPVQQCLGGWCSCRDKCAHYWAPKQKNVPPSERLCVPDEEGRAMAMSPIEIVDNRVEMAT